jgi:hypothetical protein
MQGQRFWVEGGSIGPVQADALMIGPIDERERFAAGQVRVTTGTLGTELKWVVLSPCNASLFATTCWLEKTNAPFVLRYFASGWFEEFLDTVEMATRRIEEIIARGDRHFTCHTVIKEYDIKQAPLSPLLSSFVIDGTTVEDYAVECTYEAVSKQFHVERVGRKSAIGRVYGTYLSSFACRSTSSYSDTVSEAYREVLESGLPRYDQILAAMKMPDEEVLWVPYSRLVLPKRGKRGKQAVQVIAEIGRVDIQLI